MNILKTIRGKRQYKKYLKYRGWNTTKSLNALYKSFYLDFKQAEDEIDRLRYKNRNNNKTDWREEPSNLLRLMQIFVVLICATKITFFQFEIELKQSSVLQLLRATSKPLCSFAHYPLRIYPAILPPNFTNNDHKMMIAGIDATAHLTINHTIEKNGVVYG